MELSVQIISYDQYPVIVTINIPLWLLLYNDISIYIYYIYNIYIYIVYYIYILYIIYIYS